VANATPIFATLAAVWAALLPNARRPLLALPKVLLNLSSADIGILTGFVAIFYLKIGCPTLEFDQAHFHDFIYRLV
jgi:hypothetical protein